MPSSHLILCRPLLVLPAIPQSIRVFSNESTLRMRWPKYWSFNFSISPSNEHPGLICFRMDWLDRWLLLKKLNSTFSLLSYKFILDPGLVSIVCFKISEQSSAILCRQQPFLKKQDWACCWVLVNTECLRGLRSFSGGSVAKTLNSQGRGPECDPWSGNQISHAVTKSSNATAKRSRMPQRRRKMPCATTKTQGSKINKYI